MKTTNKNRRGIKPESVQFDNQTKLNAKVGIVKDVKILGLKSRHGYDYSPQALKEARQLYEGIAVNVDHPERTKAGSARSYRDRFGRLTNVRFVEGDGLRGDLNYNPKHSIAEQFAWDVENNPAGCGLSHNASGPLSPPRGSGSRPICESIERVRSVDLVADAATNRSLFEGKPRMKVRNRKTVNPSKVRRQLIEAFGRSTARALLEAAGEDPAAMQAMAGAAEVGGDEANVEALLALIKRVIADPNISAEDTIKLVSKRLKALKEMIPGGVAAKTGGAGAAAEAGMEGLGEDDPDEDDDDEEEETHGRRLGKIHAKNGKEPNAKLQGLLDRLEAREEKLAVRELCEELKFKPSDRQFTLLLEAAEDSREDLIESWAELGENPRKLRKEGKAASRELLEGARGGAAKPAYKDSKDWARGLVSC